MTDNQLIAEFMKNDAINSPHLDPGRTQYDTSWDDLMSVVEKIELVSLNFKIETACVTIECFDDAYPQYTHTETFESQDDTKLMVCYRSVVKFVKWHNSQSRT